jgi:hypothetical protein
MNYQVNPFDCFDFLVIHFHKLMGTYVLFDIPLTLYLSDTLSSIVDGVSFLLSPSHLPLLVPLDG